MPHNDLLYDAWQVKDEDFGTDKELGITSVPLHGLKPDTEVEITKKLAPSLDTIRVKDKGDRGTITVKVSMTFTRQVTL